MRQVEVMKLVYVLVWVAAIGGFFFYFVRFGLSHLYDYSVGQAGVEFWIFRTIRIFTIKFESIEDAIEQRILVLVDNKPSSIFRGLVIGNRLAIRYIVLKMKSGLIRYVGLTPTDRRAFLEQVKRELNERSSN